MGAKNQMKLIIVAAALVLAYPFIDLLSDSGEECTGSRPLSESEKSTFLTAIKTIQSAMPAAPEGWTAQESNYGSSLPDSMYETTGCPAGSTYQVNFTNEKSIMENLKNFEKNKSTDKMEKLAAEMSAAAEKGDSKKLQKLQKEMESLSSTPAGKMMARISVRINLVHATEYIRGGRPFLLPGAKFGYLIEDTNGIKLVLYIGRWKKHEEFSINPEIVKNPSNASVQILEIIIEGDIAEQLAKTMNTKALSAMIK